MSAPAPLAATPLTAPWRVGQCELCRRWGRGGLCADCAARHGAAMPRCAGCGLRLAVAADRCAACLRDPPPFERCTCAVDYAHPWDGLIAAFKYGGRPELAGLLAATLHRALGADEAAWPELVLPLPLAAPRLAERGYNQAWELARRVAAAERRPASARVLVRPADGVHQAALGRAARLRNLRGAFRVARPAQVAGRRIALVDDVLTTGATAAAATLALRDAGAAAVHVWAVARTP